MESVASFLDPYDWRIPRGSLKIYTIAVPSACVCITKGGAIVGHVYHAWINSNAGEIHRSRWHYQLQGGRKTTTRKRIRSSVVLCISLKEETIIAKARKAQCVCHQKWYAINAWSWLYIVRWYIMAFRSRLMYIWGRGSEKGSCAYPPLQSADQCESS